MRHIAILAILLTGFIVSPALLYAQATEDLSSLKIKAEKGEAEAQFLLCALHYRGKAVPQDYTEAMKLCRKAAEQGYAAAQYSLGTMYDEGYGAPQDDAEAMKWYRKAAEQGEPNAQFNLSLMYHEGQGVPKDFEEAYFWVNLAAVVGGREEYAAGRDQYAKDLSPEALAAVQKRAKEWKPTVPPSQGDR